MRYLHVQLSKEELHWQRQLELSRHEQRRLDDQRVGVLESTPLGAPEPRPSPQTTEDQKWDNFLRRNLSEWYLKVHYPHLLIKEEPTEEPDEIPL
jgi:hypothetical protein